MVGGDDGRDLFITAWDRPEVGASLIEPVRTAMAYPEVLRAFREWSGRRSWAGSLNVWAAARRVLPRAGNRRDEAAIPGAGIYEVGDWGLRRCEWVALELVQRYRGFLDDPRRYLRHVIEDPDWLG